MALKDWKEIIKGEYYKKRQRTIQIGNSLSKPNMILVAISNGYGFYGPGASIDKYFNTKSQALKYAKQYMKTH